jgi:hypothetical protein
LRRASFIRRPFFREYFKRGTFVEKSTWISIAILAFLQVACNAGGSAGSSSHQKTVSIEAQFQPVVQNFLTEAQNQGRSITIDDLVIVSVQGLSGETMGECELDPSGASSPTIRVSQAFWDSLDSDSQEELLFHELGHCVLGRVHRDVLNNHVPVSMMASAFLGSALYNANRSQYMHELFVEEDLPDALPMSVPSGAMIPVFTPSSGQ